jgi:tungstate transport system permease protein
LSPILDGLREAVRMIIALDSELVAIVIRSFSISLTAVLISSVVCLPLGLLLALKDFKGKRVLVTLINSSLSIPTVLLGLILFLMFSRVGPLGALRLLYTPRAMIIAQALLISPIIVSLSLAAFKGVSQKLSETARTLGATGYQTFFVLLKEARYPLMAAMAMSFGRAIGELGMAMMVGGNLRGITRVMTTAIALDVRRGEFELGIALGIILLLTTLSVNIFLQILQGAGARR